MYDGTYVSGAPITSWMTTMVVTDYNGTATSGIQPFQWYVNYTGNEEYG